VNDKYVLDEGAAFTFESCPFSLVWPFEKVRLRIFLKITQALWPPKPKVLLRAALTGALAPAQT
jgi:hypothetical protein